MHVKPHKMLSIQDALLRNCPVSFCRGTWPPVDRQLKSFRVIDPLILHLLVLLAGIPKNEP